MLLVYAFASYAIYRMRYQHTFIMLPLILFDFRDAAEARFHCHADMPCFLLHKRYFTAARLPRFRLTLLLFTPATFRRYFAAA